MGLDMHLTAERYLWGIGDSPDHEISKGIGKLFPMIGDKEPKTVSVEWMYWRKANAIHKWFVDNVQDGKDECQKTYVDPAKLAELRDLCQQVHDDNSLAESLLPTASGFFFGGTEYDEYYFSDIENTLAMLDDLLKKIDGKELVDWDFYYQASW